MARRWIVSAASENRDRLSAAWGVPPLVAQLLINRGLQSPDRGSAFLAPQLNDLYPPQRLPGARRAADLLAEAVRRRKKILIYGDYDVDGIMGLSILWHMLRVAGAEVTGYVPHRIEEGYGLNAEAVRRCIEEGAGLIVTVDCGITAVDEAKLAAQAGVPLIITDHHEPQETLPSAEAVVHPGLDGYPNPHLSGAGVAFKLAWCLGQVLSGDDRVEPRYRETLLQMLPLAALGTIADVVPLVEENRIIARHGLAALKNTAVPGLQALIESAGLKGANIDGYDVGFKLAPRINAAGRMGHARLAVELFTRADTDRAREIALYLEDHNRARQTVERRIAREVYERIDRDNLAGDARRAVVVAGEGWHAGVIGIVAARVVDRYHRPAVLISLNNGEGQGSARSIGPFPLHEALADCRNHLLSYGGHAMAAGLRIETSRLEGFREAFVQTANERLTGDDLVPRLRLDAEVELSEINLPTAECIRGMGPFGNGNPKPKLASGWVELAEEPRAVGRSSDHLQGVFRQNGVWLKGIGFGLASQIEDLKHRRRCRLAFEPIINEFKGRRSVEMQIVDMQFEA